MAGPFGVVRYGRDEMAVHEDEMASGSADIEPGMLLERVDSGGDVRVQPHSTAAEAGADALVAVEARDRGMNAQTGDVQGEEADVYSTSGDSFPMYVQASGGGLYVLLAAGENVAAGDRLVSNGDGNLRAAAGDGTESGAHVFEVEEGLDNSGASDAALVAATPV